MTCDLTYRDKTRDKSDKYKSQEQGFVNRAKKQHCRDKNVNVKDMQRRI